MAGCVRIGAAGGRVRGQFGVSPLLGLRASYSRDWDNHCFVLARPVMVGFGNDLAI